MGSPSMNFATVEPRGGQRLAVTFDGREVEIPDALARYPQLARRLGARVIIGLRPAAFTAAGPADLTALRVVPLGVESLGDEKHVLFEAPRTGASDASPAATGDLPVAVDDPAAAPLWTAKLSQDADVAIGRPLWLAVDLTEAYFFDPDNGQAIPAALPSQPPAPAVQDTQAVPQLERSR